MKPHLQRVVATGAGLAGLLVPGLFVLATWMLTGSAVRVMLAVTVAALLNLPAPLGGGMGMQRVLRLRWMRWEWTFDSDRSVFEALASPFLLSTVAVGGFFVAAPVVGVLLRWIGPFRTGVDEVLTLVAALLLAGAGVVLHRPELSLRSLRRRFEQKAGTPPPEELALMVRRLSALAGPDGGLGHVGGIGVWTVGLHEHLDAEALLRLASERELPGAAELHSRCLDHLLSRAEPAGGFSPYPGGMPRVEYTARALEALRGRLDESALLRHREALLACRREDGRFGRSMKAPSSEEATHWARRVLGESR